LLPWGIGPENLHVAHQGQADEGVEAGVAGQAGGLHGQVVLGQAGVLEVGGGQQLGVVLIPSMLNPSWTSTSAGPADSR
jgi:hypothetical protein